jgi:hypothetical protein
MGVLGDDLLYCELFTAFYVLAQPHQAETPPTQ